MNAPLRVGAAGCTLKVSAAGCGLVGAGGVLGAQASPLAAHAVRSRQALRNLSW